MALLFHKSLIVELGLLSSFNAFPSVLVKLNGVSENLYIVTKFVNYKVVIHVHVHVMA